MLGLKLINASRSASKRIQLDYQNVSHDIRGHSIQSGQCVNQKPIHWEAMPMVYIRNIERRGYSFFATEHAEELRRLLDVIIMIYR